MTDFPPIPYRELGEFGGDSRSPVIPVEIRNGTKTEHAFLLLDTGTYYTELSERLFDRLGLKKTGVMSTVHRKTVPTAHIDVITIGNMPFSMDVGLYEEVRRKLGGKDIDGILGTDILSTGVVVIDPEKRHVILTDGAIPDSTGRDLTLPLLLGETGTYSLSVLVHGEKRRFTVDTGAFGSLIDRRSVPKGSAKAIPCFPMRYARGRMDVCSAITGLQIAETRFPDLSISVLPHPVAVDTDGTLGMDLLAQGTVTLDFPNNKMYFRQYKVATPAGNVPDQRQPRDANGSRKETEGRHL